MGSRGLRRKKGRWRRRAQFLVMLGVVFFVLLAVRSLRRATTGARAPLATKESLQTTILRLAAGHGIEREAITEEGQWLVFPVPEGRSAAQLATEMASAAQRLGVDADRAEEQPGDHSVRLVFRTKGRVLLRCHLKPVLPAGSPGPYIALVIDDFGYSTGEVTRDFLSLPCDITVSVIPGLPFSKEVAELAAAGGKEVMVHMPMEALHEQVEDRGYTLFVAFADEEIRSRVRLGIASVPHARGLNNHQGSRATADERVMRILMEELRAQNLYFVDSRTNSGSVAAEVASRLGVRCIANGAFLDVDPDTASVRRQLWKLAQLAKRRNGALGIGHARRNTLEVLRREIPKLAQEGYRVVPVSKLLGVPAPPIAMCEQIVLSGS
ncbi:MAG: divergent polysaccharide deacetylase family protein [candidate division KSB1 bacterium]|nr:divergent polysaccharide deacetylase family protein [candidate division KSB1 bacterium]MDZ7412647.1 divergent polysaccharide deacetylase family protein [candidate division KSB1 bacterium]